MGENVGKKYQTWNPGLRELEKISENDLIEKLGFSESELFHGYKDKLIEKRILFVSDDGFLVFDYVGALIINNNVIFCIPKYICNNDRHLVIGQLFLLFQEYSKRENLEIEEIETLGEIENLTEYNMLSVMIFLLNDYYEYGLYSNQKANYELNGEDEIIWDYTLNEIQPLIINNKPIFLDFYTSSHFDDEEDYFRTLHKFILTECSTRLELLGLSEYFSYPKINYEIEEDIFGQTESILSKIINELPVQFINRKQRVLKAIYSYISHERIYIGGQSLCFFGTRNFNLVWEKTCAFVLNNQIDKFIHLIDKPKWITNSGIVHEGYSIIPDILSAQKIKNKKYFFIADAKYYNLLLTDNILSNYPGVEDVNKQYLYQMSFSEFMNSQNYEIIQNSFIFPTEGQFEKIGFVTIDFLKKQNLKDILLIKLPANIVFDLYIRSKRIDLEKFLNLEIVAK